MTAAERDARRRAFAALPADEQRAIRDRLQQLLEHARWQRARDPTNVHDWTQRRWWDDEAFVYVVTHIQALGYRARFRNASYVQLDVGEHFFWTMGWPVNWPDGTPCTRIINRKPLSAKGDDGDGDRHPALPFD